jgi:hypothetical protein
MAHFSASVAFVLQSQPQSAPFSPAPVVLLALAIIGAVSDRRYLKAGGRPPSKNDRIVSSCLAGVLLVFLIWLGFRGASAEALGRLTGFLLVLYWFAWEFGRSRMRRKYPLVKPKSERLVG